MYFDGVDHVIYELNNLFDPNSVSEGTLSNSLFIFILIGNVITLIICEMMFGHFIYVSVIYFFISLLVDALIIHVQIEKYIDKLKKKIELERSNYKWIYK